MVRRNHRHLSHVPNAHLLGSFAKSAQKIGSLDCPLSSGPGKRISARRIEPMGIEPDNRDSLDLSVLEVGSRANSASSSARSLFATLQQSRRFHFFGPGRESQRRTAPAQRLYLLKEPRVGAQRREILE